MKADDSYATLMSVPSPAKPIVVAGPRLYWRAVVKCAGKERSQVEWHSAACAAPANDCHGCEPNAG